MSELFIGDLRDWSFPQPPASFRGIPLEFVEEAVEFTTEVHFPPIGPQPCTLWVDGKAVGEFAIEFVGTKPETDESGKPVLDKDGQPVVNAEYRLTKVEHSP
jgi:hypothetical protein